MSVYKCKYIKLYKTNYIKSVLLFFLSSAAFEKTAFLFIFYSFSVAYKIYFDNFMLVTCGL